RATCRVGRLERLARLVALRAETETPSCSGRIALTLSPRFEWFARLSDRFQTASRRADLCRLRGHRGKFSHANGAARPRKPRRRPASGAFRRDLWSGALRLECV